MHDEAVPFVVPDLSALPDGFAAYLQALHSPAAAAAAIPVEQTNGPVLLLNGADDQLWPSPEMSRDILTRLKVHRHPFPDRLLSFSESGHLVTLPGLPSTSMTFGGTPAGVARAAKLAWAATLRFLDDNLACAPHGQGTSRLAQLHERIQRRVCIVLHRISRSRSGRNPSLQ
jgi:hypothetical protein